MNPAAQLLLEWVALVTAFLIAANLIAQDLYPTLVKDDRRFSYKLFKIVILLALLVAFAGIAIILHW